MIERSTLPLADERTRIALDFASVCDRVVAGTRTARGRALAVELLPHVDFALVHLEQARTAVIRDLVASADFHVSPAVDTSEMTQTAALGRTLSPTDLRSIADAIASAAGAYNALREHRQEALSAIVARYTPLKELYKSLDDAIDERGTVLDRASKELARIRRSISQAQNDARDKVASIMRSEKYARAIQDSVVTVREGRLVVPVKAEFAGEFPGIVHDTSGTGQTIFVEPLAALDSNNRVRTLRLEEEREVLRILSELSQSVGAWASEIESNVEMLAQLDVIVSKANLARAMNALAPELSEQAMVYVLNGRHPLLGDRAVPQTLSLDETTRLLVISGPNMGGKTVALKTVGLFVLMTYAGLQIPASHGTQIGRFRHVLADIGDEQSIVANASTFSAHLARMREMLDLADDHALVLIDEIGGGTEPGAGAALAVAMLERLIEARTLGVVTTHATELKLFASATTGVANGSVRFDPTSFKPTYQLDIGAPGQSLAFPLAEAMGIDSAIVERAQSLLDSRERDYEAALAELSLRSQHVQTERDAVGRERMTLAKQTADLETERTRYDAERRSFAERAEQKMQSALREFVAELQKRAESAQSSRPKVTGAQSELLSRTSERMRQELGIKASAPQVPDSKAPFERDERVRVLSLEQDGTVVEDYGDTALIAIGPMKMVVKRGDLQRRGRSAADKKPKAKSSGGSTAQMEAASRTMAELDVRGMRFVDAEPLVEKWIDEASLGGNASLRLIHGKGTGMLGRGLQEYLRTNPAVKSLRYGNEHEGSGGVTIVELEG